MMLRVTGLACMRGGVPLLEGVSFDLHPREALALRGPNGCGKTTLLRTIAGLQPALAGKVVVPQDSIAYAGHADGIKASLTVAENLSFWAAIHGAEGRGAAIHGAEGRGADRIATALDQMNLHALSGRAAATLSAGQKRRLGLARLIVTGRPIWVLDEPTVSLDQASVALFASVMRAHLARGGMALMATHIDLGLPEADLLDLAPFKASASLRAPGGFDEAFL
ncbi:MAG: heme ABC exporter ATP-binding protein CcmA [Roseinatronobacter sp.]